MEDWKNWNDACEKTNLVDPITLFIARNQQFIEEEVYVKVNFSEKLEEAKDFFLDGNKYFSVEYNVFVAIRNLFSQISQIKYNVLLLILEHST